MRTASFAVIALAVLSGPGPGAQAETLGNARVGFTAERVLVLDGHSYIGRMWNMPGEQRHEQDLPSAKPVFILRADSTIADLLLPQLHTVVQFALPKVLSVLGAPGELGKAVGTEMVNGVATTKYAVDRNIADGHLSGSLWLSTDGIPMRANGSFGRKDGKVSTVRWELRHVSIGPQDAALFVVPSGYSKLPPEAAATLLGLRLARHAKH